MKITTVLQIFSALWSGIALLTAVLVFALAIMILHLVLGIHRIYVNTYVQGEIAHI